MKIAKYEPQAADAFIKASGTYEKNDDTPAWIDAFESDISSILIDDSFSSASYRESNNFKGLDYIHSSVSGINLSQYRLTETPQTNWFKVEAIVQFSANCEFAKGWVHRGAICALMDDAANFAGFCVSGNLNIFSGFTSHVDCKLKRPVRVNSVLKLVGQIMEIRNRTDVIVQCSLIDPAYNNAVHCQAHCVFVMNETAAEMMESMVAMRQKSNSGGSRPSSSEWTPPQPWSTEMPRMDFETKPDPLFRPPNRVGRYGLGMKISKDVAEKIDERVARKFVPKSGDLVKNSEKHSIRKRREKEEAEKLAAEELAREKAKHHPARSYLWRTDDNI